MTDLLTPSTTRGAQPASAPRSLVLPAALAAFWAAGVVLLGCMALGLAGWFAADAGGYGDTRDALRVGADAWLLAHGSTLELAGARISMVPLGLTLLSGYALFRAGRRAGHRCAPDSDRSVVLGSLVLAGVYGVVGWTTAVLAGQEQARTQPAVALLGCFLLALLAGGAGLLSGSGRTGRVRDLLPGWVRAACVGALGGALLVGAAGALLVAVGLLLDFGSAANVLARLHTGVSGGLLYSVVVASVVPNAALLGGAYLVGPGFAVGAGTVVSPATVVLGPVPAFPLLAALPGDGATPAWAIALLGLPVLLGALAAILSLHRDPVTRYDRGALRGLVVGAGGGLLFGAFVALAGGSVGPGRMQELGAAVGPVVLSAAVAMGAGGLVAGLAATWWRRWTASRAGPEPEAGSAAS